MWSHVALKPNEEATSIPSTSCNVLNSFETCTVAKVSRLEPVTQDPKVCCVSSPNYCALCLDSSLTILNSSCTEVIASHTLNTNANCLALNDYCNAVFIGENDGTFSVFHIPSSIILFQKNIVTDAGPEEKPFKSIICIPDKELFRIYILTSKNELHLFYDIDCSSILEAVNNEDSVSNVMKLQVFNLTERFLDFSPTLLYQNVVDEKCPVYLMGKGTAVDIGSKESDLPFGTAIFKGLSDEIDITKIVSSTAGRSLICLDSKNSISVICSQTHHVVSKWETANVQDFAVQELNTSSGDPNTELKIYAILEQNDVPEAECVFQIVLFPSFKTLCSLTVDKFAFLSSTISTQGFMYLVEGEHSVLHGEKTITSVVVHTIIETSEEKRLLELLESRKFQDAEKFVSSQNIDEKIVYKAKINAFMKALPSSKFHKDDLSRNIKEMEQSLFKNKDLNLINTCMEKHFVTSEQAKYFFELSIKWLDEIPDEEEKKNQLVSKINKLKTRLVTFEILSESNCITLQWQKFSICDLLTYFMDELVTYNTFAAVIVWQRHQGELACRILPLRLEEILNSISESVPSEYLIPFLQNDFFPSIFCSVEGAMNIVVQWMIERVYLFETNEKDKWPENGKLFLEIVSNVCETLQDSFSKGRVNFSTHIDLQSVFKNSVDLTTPIGHLYQLIRHLDDLIQLKRKFECCLPLAEYCDEDKMVVLFSLLNNIEVPHLPEALDMIGKRFVVTYNMDFDSCLYLFIKDTLEKSSHTWWHREAAPWEGRLLSIMEFIQDRSIWMDSAMTVVYKAPVPWSDGVKTIVDTGLATEHPKRVFLEAQTKLIGLKLVLIKYELHEFPINDDEELALVLVNYILKQNKDTVVDDILVVYQTYEKLFDEDAYSTVLVSFLNNNNVESLKKLITSLSLDTSVVCCELLLRYIIHHLDDSFELQKNKPFCKNLAHIGTFLIRYLNTVNKPTNRETQFVISSIAALQKEFGKFVLPSALSSSNFCLNELSESINLVLSGVSIVEPDTEERKTAVLTSSISQIYRLSRLLGIEQEETMAHLVFKFVEQNKYKEALELCSELSSCYPNQSTSETLIRVIRLFFKKFSSISNFNFKTITETIHHLICIAVTFCDKKKLNEFTCVGSHSQALKSLNSLTPPEGTLYCNITRGSSVYHNWRFSTLFSDEGLFIEPSKALLLLHESYLELLILATSKDELNDYEERVFKALEMAKTVIEHLKMKSQMVAVHRIFAHTVSLIALSASCSPRARPDVLESLNHIIHYTLQQSFNSIFPRVLSQRNCDSLFLFGIFSLLPSETAIQIFENPPRWCYTNAHHMLTLFDTGVKYSFYHGLHVLATTLVDHCNKLRWILEHTSSISTEAILNMKYEEERTVIKNIISTHDMNLQSVHTCSEVFNITYEDALLMHLHNLLFGSRVSKWKTLSEFPRKEVDALLLQVGNAISEFSRKQLIFDNLITMFQNANPYYYEILMFILEKLVAIWDESDDNSTDIGAINLYKTHIALLKFLQLYKRISPPGELETEQWENMSSDKELPAISEMRLPFHSLLKGKAHRIINPELTATSVLIWLDATDILKLSADDLIIIAVKNTVTKYNHQHEKSKNSNHVVTKPDVNLINMLQELNQKIENPEKSVACAMHVINAMPTGANKVYAAEKLMSLVQAQVALLKSNSSVGIVQKMQQLHQHHFIEQVLYRHNFAKEECLSCPNAKELAQHLIENYCFPVGESVKVCKIIQEIASVVPLNHLDMYFSFLCTCLTPSQVEDNLNESFLIRDDSLQLNAMKEFNNRRNLEKAICFALGLSSDILETLMRLVYEKFLPLGITYRARVLSFLLAVASSTLISKTYGDVSKLKETLKLKLCMTDLENIQLVHCSDTFNNCDKLEFVERVLMSYSLNPKALLCCVKICLEYQIWSAPVWSVILQKMREKYMINELREVLISAGGGLSHLWHTKNFADSWNYILMSACQEEVEPLEVAIKVYGLLLRCPCDTELEIKIMCELLKKLKVIPPNADEETCTLSILISLLNKYLSGLSPSVEQLLNQSILPMMNESIRPVNGASNNRYDTLFEMSYLIHQTIGCHANSTFQSELSITGIVPDNTLL